MNKYTLPILLEVDAWKEYPAEKINKNLDIHFLWRQAQLVFEVRKSKLQKPDEFSI